MRIGITARYDIQEEEENIRHFYVNEYFRNIFEALDVTLLPIISSQNLGEVVDICDGLLVPGNKVDIDPKYYQETAVDSHTNLAAYNEFELDKPAIEAFYKKHKKIMGICAGMQAMNVCFGGTLYQHIEGHEFLDGQLHDIRIQQDSNLYKIYQEDYRQVNSRHHQAVKEVAPAFSVTAVSGDGVIEAIESDNALGVQWHPEMMGDGRIFREFFCE